MVADLKAQWSALFPFANQVGEFIAVAREGYALFDRIFGQSDGSRGMWVSLMAAVVTGAALFHRHVKPRTQRMLEIAAHMALQMVMLVLVGGAWVVFPVLHHLVVRGHFKALSITLVSTALVSGWGKHCDPEGQTLTHAVSAWVGWAQVDAGVAWTGVITFTLMVFAIGGTFV
jgi:hypothetical protein